MSEGKMKIRHLLFLAVPLSLAAQAASAVTVSFKAPTEGGVLVGNYFDSTRCEVTGNSISRVEFFLGSAKLNTELNAPWHCSFDSRTFANGPYVLKAVAYDKKGRSATAQVNVTVQNNSAPSVSITAPAAGATLSGMLEGAACEASATDSDGSVVKVDFYIGSKLVTTSAAAPFQCAVNTATYPNGQYTLMAIATDNLGASASTQRNVTFENADAPPAPAATPIDAADIIGQASADVPFAQQSGYTAQVIGTFTAASAIPESGIHGSTLPNGETLRFGKVVDPDNSILKALAFQVHPSDPDTSGANRVELRMPDNIELDKVYWIALGVYVYDWGLLALEDRALFATQIHSGDNSLGLSPSFSIYTVASGRNFKVQARWSTSESPTPGNSVAANYAEQPIPFGRWIDFVFKFKHNTAGSGFLQVWMDGTQIVDHQGNLGFNTPGYQDYAKFGYYNWSSAMNSARKVLLRSPTLVADPTGKYSADDLRAHIQPAP
jgi:hypothetical protein